MNLSHTIFLDVNHKFIYRLSFKTQTIEKVKRKNIKDKKYEIFKMPYELLFGIITRHFFWDNVNTSHVYFVRKNCELNRHTLHLMNYLNI